MENNDCDRRFHYQDFIDPQGKMMSATVERGAAPKIGIPRKLFDTGLVPDYRQSVCGHRGWT
jgi:hypothetical protein